MNKGHVPIRTCVACRRKRPAGELIRLKALGDAVVIADRQRDIPGRGCYVCPTAACVEAALKKGCLARALRRIIAAVPSKEALLRGQEQEEVTG